MTVGPLGRGGAGAGSTVTKSLAMGAVYESTGIGNWFTIFPAGFTTKSPHGTSLSPTSAHRRYTWPAGSAGRRSIATAPLFASKSRATEPTAPDAGPRPLRAKERTM